jgi:hypothetical protein
MLLMLSSLQCAGLRFQTSQALWRSARSTTFCAAACNELMGLGQM